MRNLILAMIGLGITLFPRKPGVDISGGGDTTTGGATDVILRAGDTASGILKAGSTDYIKKAG